MAKAWKRSEISVEGGSGSACSGFIVSVANDGIITATPAVVTYSGPADSGYTVPTWVDTGEVLDHVDGGGTVAATGTILVWVKISYSAVDSTNFGTAWQLDNVEFDFGAARPSDTTPSWDTGTSAWSPTSGTHYADWATVVDRVVTNSNGGGINLAICSPNDVKVINGCSV